MDEKLLLEQIDAFVAENRENVLRDLKTLVDINSVEGQPQPGAPFGPGPRKALEAALDIAAGMGLEDVYKRQGMVGDMGGRGNDQFFAFHRYFFPPFLFFCHTALARFIVCVTGRLAGHT